MIIATNINPSILAELKNVDEVALRNAADIKTLDGLGNLIDEVFCCNIEKQLRVGYILKFPTNCKAYKHIANLNCFFAKKTNHLLVIDSISRVRDFVTDILSEDFDEELTLSFYLQVCSIYTDLETTYGKWLSRLHKVPVMDGIFILKD